MLDSADLWEAVTAGERRVPSNSNRLIVTAAIGLMGAVMAQSAPAAAQSQPTPLERFLALPPDRQEALRNEVQPLFFRTMQANGRLNRMAKDCNMPLPTEATPAAKLEADLQSPQSTIGKLFGPARQGALLARLRGATQTTIDCHQAVDLRPDMIRELREFPQKFESVLEHGLAAAGQPAPARPGSTSQDTKDLPRLMIGAPGHCELSTGGKSQPCISGLIYVQSRQGPIMITVQSTPSSTIGFQGNDDSQKLLEHYTLHLNRMQTSVDGHTAGKDVTGTCEISMTADGQIWHQATCRARDGNGLETVMTFTGDGRSVTTARPDQTKAPS